MNEYKGRDLMATDYQYEENDRKTRLLQLYELEEIIETLPEDTSVGDILEIIQNMRKALRDRTSKR